MLISTDRRLFSQESSVFNRIQQLGTRFSEDIFDFIIFSRTRQSVYKESIASNTTAYGTQSLSRLLYGIDALRIATNLPRPDLVSAQDPFETGLIGLIIARILRVPFAVQIHTDFLEPGFSRHSLLNRMRLLIARFVLPCAVGGYVVSEKIRTQIIRKYGLTAPFSVLPVFVDIQRFSVLPQRPISGNFLWVGRFTREKRPEVALRAVAAARSGGHDVRLTMLGDGPRSSALRRLAAKLNIAEFVHFPGWKDPASYLPETELLLVTSAYEGYGMVLVEALAAGVPVLSTDVGIACEYGAIIARENYPHALIDWLSGKRSRGVLKEVPYANNEEYLNRLREHFIEVSRT